MSVVKLPLSNVQSRNSPALVRSLAFGALVALTGLVAAVPSMGQSEPASANRSTGDEIREQVQKWIDDLDSDSISERRNAVKELVALGPQVLAMLPASQPGDSPERSEGLLKVRLDLERLAAEETLRPSRVTIRGSYSLDEALELIRDQTGNDFAPINVRTTAQEIDIQDLTYWQSIQKLLDLFPSVKLNSFRSGEQQLLFSSRGDDPTSTSSVFVQGPFWIEPQRVQLLSDLTNPVRDSLNLVVRIRWEPRLEPIALVHDLDRLRIVTDDGSTLRSLAGRSTIESSVGPKSSWIDVSFAVEKPPRAATQIVDLEGRFRITLPAETSEFVFDSLPPEKPEEQRIGATTVSLVGVRKVGELEAVQIRVRFDEAAGSLESHRQWMFDNVVALQPSNGERIAYFTYETTLQRSDEVGISYLFGIDEDISDYRFIYQVPSAILNRSIDWEGNPIDLP